MLIFRSFRAVRQFAVALALPAALIGNRAVAQPSPGAVTAPPSAGVLARYSAAAELQNRGQYDRAAQRWTELLRDFPDDSLSGRARHYLGVCQLQLKQFDKAAESFAAIVQDDPEFPWIDQSRFYLGWAQYLQARAGHRDGFARAAAAFAELVEQCPNSPLVDQALLYEGESLDRDGKQDQAIPVYTRLIREHPKSDLLADALYALAVAHQQRGHHQQAEKALDRFLDQFPRHSLATEVRMRKAETRLQQGDPVGAEKLFTQVAKIDGFAMADHAIFRQADCAALQRQFDRAAALYARVARDYPRSEHAAEAAMLAGRAYFQAKSFNQAGIWFQKALNQNGKRRVEAAHRLCQTLLQVNRPAQAAQLAAQVLTRAPSDDPYRMLLELDQADALDRLPGRRVEAYRRYLSIALRYRGQVRASQSMYGAAYTAMQLKMYQDALDVCRDFLQWYPQDRLAADVVAVQAECRLGQGQYAQAERRYDQLLQDHATHPEADRWRIRLAMAQLLQKKYQQTVDTLQPIRAPQLDAPTAAELQFLLGASYCQLGRREKGVDALEACLAADPHSHHADQALLRLAVALRELDRVDPSRKALQRLIADFPRSKLRARAQFELGQCSLDAGDFEAAAEQFAAVVDRWPNSKLAHHALYEKGWGLEKLGRPDEAAQCYQQVAETVRTELGARARLSLGKLLLGQNEVSAAMRQFRLLLYGYGGPKAPAEIRAWQARGGVEAGRCAAKLADGEEEPGQRELHRAAARKYYRYVLENYRETAEATIAAHELQRHDGP